MEQDQYGMPDLRQYMSTRPNLFPAIPPPPDLLSSHRGLAPPNPYDMLMFRSDSTTNAGGASSGAGCSLSGFDSNLNGGGDGGTARWPRQETLTLLEIRSRLDPKFKEANQKGPLWDEVSRIMSEEHGYQRSGKKCREKFENLYKYYKKTKEGKAGRQDGKHYRFFRQLEALYGDQTSNNSASMSETHLLGGNFLYNFPNNNPSAAYNQEAFQGTKLSDTSLSLSNYSDSETTNSSDNNDPNDQGIDDNDQKKRKQKGKRNWKVKIKNFIDYQMKKLMDKQEALMEMMVKTIEQKEHERMLREEEWRKQDAIRIEREHKFWASERAWIEARDAAIMDALHKFTGKELNVDDESHETMNNNSSKGDIWPECEINRLIQLRSGMDLKFHQTGISEEILWEEISRKMACFGHERSAIMCKEKWDCVNNYLLKCNKKTKEITSKGCTFYQNHESIGGAYCEQQGLDHHTTIRLNDHGNSSSSPNNNNNTGNNVTDSCFRYFMGDPYGRIMD